MTKQQKRLSTLLKVAEEVYGVDPLRKCRKTAYVRSRTAIAERLRKSKCTYAKIAEYLNLSTHANVAHILKNHELDMRYNAEYRGLFQKFCDATKELKHCAFCNTDKDLYDFTHYYERQRKKIKVSSYCKECFREVGRKAHHAKKARKAEVIPIERFWTDCVETSKVINKSA